MAWNESRKHFGFDCCGVWGVSCIEEEGEFPPHLSLKVLMSAQIIRKAGEQEKIKQSLTTCLHGRNPGKLTCQNGHSPHLKYHPQLKTKEDVGGGERGPSEGRKAVHR